MVENKCFHYDPTQKVALKQGLLDVEDIHTQETCSFLVH